MIKLLEKVIEIICDYQGIDKASVSENSNLISDIGLSSYRNSRQKDKRFANGRRYCKVY